MRDRLMNELKKAKNKCLIYESGGCVACTYRDQADCTLENIADHLLANGVIVPPCKVGDTVYWYGMVNHLVEAKIVAIDSGAKARVGKTDFEYDLLGEDFGKAVFFTKEEAERALKEREKSGR